MEQIEIECEFITPAFTYGNNKELEIRATTIKGMMRYWWERTKTNDDVDTVQLFGGKIKNDIKKGKANIVCNDNLKYIKINSDLFNQIKTEKDEENGLNYLFYAPKYLNKNLRHYNIGTTFTVIIKSNNSNDLLNFVDALNRLQILGGIGGRNRRGGGNFIINKVTCDDQMVKPSIMKYDNFITKQSSCENIKNSYISLIKKLEENNIKAFLFTSIKEDDYIQVLKKIGEKYKEARNKYKFHNKGIGSPLIIKPIYKIEEGKAGVLILEEGLNKEKMNNKMKNEKEIINELKAILIKSGEFKKLYGSEKNE
ncbi:RAMP superfamily CRISPR-associated protein [Natranaerovirga hydrolytica]|uniref:RAMP superfamily CRISPR-associated protein n=1 Tax=Natranaerovirga hydrolytica TaxID=680378 RepID=UPI0014033342|nr:RAMP superfamily CRISPR-associated protein [Natranaerovirga hydrolytica]